ncbi:MAG: hypothetical protein WDN26_05700 [Chitinophagaceae bacterium]
MKKSIFVVALLFAGSVTLMAQGGGPRRTIEERVQMIHAKMDSAFKLESAKLVQVDSLFAGYYRSQDKLREETTAAGGDFQAMREKMTPLTEARDEKLKPIIGEANFKTWKEVIEPSMRPQRRNN